ncbi:uncharacterized protein DFL_005654 [Arthrobotrys flagrans]|uniref:C3H1-type domain-containing protein n=1 Tax=Arthrobotrys flagrans TaxID=97331 RepID=A0A436ZY37_ARTFL|nr:hypothetical protein DFL_005654 [Arthrobotrys flagrans]
MTRQMRGAVHPTVKARNEITVPADSQLYAFCSRMKQTPVRSMLMAHGCCFDFFEKGICKAGNDCKYSHLKPGDERNLVMDSEAGLRRKKYYRPETLETYRPGSQDVICFTFARKGWCIHGDKCWNQHISPPGDLFGELGPRTSNGYRSGFGITQPLARHHLLRNSPSPSGLTNPNWSSTTIAPMHSGQHSGYHPGQHLGQYPGQHSDDCGKQKQPYDHSSSRPHTQNKGTYFCNPDPQRTAAPNWRIPNNPAAIAASTPSPVQPAPVFEATPAPIIKAAPAPIAKLLPVPAPAVKSAPVQAAVVKTPPITLQPQPVRSALTEFNWRPIIQDQAANWRKTPGTKKSTTVGSGRSVLPVLQIPTRTGALPRGNGNAGVTTNYSLVNLSDDGEYDQRKYRIGGFDIGRVQSTVPSLH